MCNHLTNFAILMDLVDDGAETLQQLSFFNENMKLMISISVAVCIIFIIIALITLKLFNGIFVKVRNRRREGAQSSTNGRDDIIIHTNPNNTGVNVLSSMHYTQNTLMSSDCGSASATSQNSSTPLNVLRNINYVPQSSSNRSHGGSIRVNNNIFSGRSHDQNNRNNLQNINNNRNVINSNSNLVNNNIAFVRETEIGNGMNGIHDGVIVMRNNVINGLVGINPGIQYHLHHHLHHHHHHSASEVSSLSSQSSPSLEIPPSHHQV